MLTLEEIDRRNQEYFKNKETKNQQYQSQIREGVRQSVRSEFTPQKPVYPEFAKANVDEELEFNKVYQEQKKYDELMDLYNKQYQPREERKSFFDSIKSLFNGTADKEMRAAATTNIEYNNKYGNAMERAYTENPRAYLDMVSNNTSRLKKQSSFLSTLGTSVMKGVDMASVVGDLITSRQAPTLYEAKKRVYEENPTASTIGAIGGSILPFSILEKGILKVLPKLLGKQITKEMVKGYTKKEIAQALATQIGKTTARGALAGGAYGGVEASIQGFADRQSIPQILTQSAEGVGTYAVGGAIFGGVGGAIGQAWGNRAITKAMDKSLQNIDNSYSRLSGEGISGYSGGTPIRKVVQNPLPKYYLANSDKVKGTYTAPSRLERADMITKRKAIIKPKETVPQTDVKALPAPVYRQPPSKPVKLGETPQRKFKVKPREIAQSVMTYRRGGVEPYTSIFDRKKDLVGKKPYFENGKQTYKEDWELDYGDYKKKILVDETNRVLPDETASKIDSKYQNLYNEYKKKIYKDNKMKVPKEGEYTITKTDKEKAIEKELLDYDKKLVKMAKKETQDAITKEIERRRYFTISDAVESAKPVPPKILKEYLTLHKKYGKIISGGDYYGRISTAPREPGIKNQIRRVEKNGQVYDFKTTSKAPGISTFKSDGKIKGSIKQYSEQMGDYKAQSAEVTRQKEITKLGRDITQGQIKSNIEQPFKATPGQVTGYAKNVYEAGKPRKFKVENGDINIIRKTPTQVKVPGETISEKLSRLGRKKVYESELVSPETTGTKKIVSNRQIPDINKWTKAEFEEYYGINKRYDPKNIRNLMEDSGARIMNKVGSDNIPTILSYYQKKYNLPFIKIGWNTGSGRKLGKTEVLGRDANGNVTGYKVNINPNQSIEGKVATLRHEIEHVIDLQRGFKGRVPKELTKLEQIKMARQTLSEGYVKSQKGEHSKYDWFEADYLRRAAIKDALKAGEKVPDEVLKEYPDLANIKPVKESISRSAQEQNVPLESQTKSAFTDEVNSKLIDLETKHKERINSLKNDKVMDSELKEKQIKAEGMKYSAKKREVIQGDSLVKVEGGLTEKELADKIKYLKSNYSGKKVITPDGEGISTGQSSFGKVGVKINGEVKYYPKENVQAKVDIDAKIAEQKRTTASREGQIRQENTQERINSPSRVKSTTKTQTTSSQVGTPTEKTIGETAGDGKLRERGYSKNERTNVNSDKTLQENLESDKLMYMQLGEKGSYKRAKEIFDKGFDTALRYFKAIETYEPHDVPLAHMIANAAAKSGDIPLAREVIGEISRILTNAGRIGEAAKIMRRSDPLAYYGFIQRRIDSFNREGAKRYGKKWNDLKLSDDIEKEILNLEIIDEATMARLMEQTERNLAEQMPADAWEKWDAWRRMAMLLNPKTHVRNLGGNAMMQVLRKTSDTLAIPFEKAFLKPGQRTKSIFWSKDKNLVQKVTDDWANVKNDLMTNSKYGLETLGNLSQEKRIFRNNMLEWWNKKSSELLNIEDEYFMGRAYRDALGQYMKSNGLKDISEAARQYASRRALEATFRQTNEFANWLIRGKKMKGFGKLLEAAMPFTKTPLNLAKTAVEYSPGALVKVLFDIKAGPAQVIETLSKGLVGTSLMGLGWWLGSMGWAKSNYEKAKKAKALMEESGDQPYSITTPIGSYTFDWSQPSSLPIAMGVTLAEALSKNLSPDKEMNLTRAIGNSLLSAGDAYFNMTVLKNIKDILGGGYQSTTAALASLPIDYLEQGIPAIVGQLSRSIDTKKRLTYDPNPLIMTGKEAMNRTLLSLFLPESVGLLGETKKQPGWYQQFLLPGTGKLKNDDPLVKELNRLYDIKKTTDFIPKVVERSFDVDNLPVWLKPKEMETFQRDMGKMNKESMTNAINSSFYQSGSDNYKANRLKTIAENNYTRAKRKILDARGVQTRIKTYNVPIKTLKRVAE